MSGLDGLDHPGAGHHPGAALNGVRRARELAEATDGRVVDLLVVGLGVTGAGARRGRSSRSSRP